MDFMCLFFFLLKDNEWLNGTCCCVYPNVALILFCVQFFLLTI